MKNWTIKTRIALGFFGVIAVAAGLGAFALHRLSVISTNSVSLIEDTVPSLKLISTAQTMFLQNQLLLDEHISNTEHEIAQDLERQIKANAEVISQAVEGYSKSVKSDEDRRVFKKMSDARAAYLAPFNQALELSRTNPAVLVMHEFVQKELDPARRAYATALVETYEYESRNTGIAGTAISSSVHSAIWGIIVGLGLAIMVGLILGSIITRSVSGILRAISDSLDHGSAQVATASSQVSANSKSLADGASEQAASLEETSSSLEELSSMTKRNADSAGAAKALSTETRIAAETGDTDMAEMRQAMEAIKVSSNDIAKIIRTIDEIAFQTNILALNAAVEAARAGEAGAGFAVVADEVRALAQRSANSAKETASKIEVAIQSGERGVLVSGKIAGSLEVIVQKARKVDELVAEIAIASKEQSQGIAQINTAVSQMDKVTQSNAGGAEETAAAAAELNAQAASLRESVTSLRNLVDGQSGSSVRTAVDAPLRPAENFKPAKVRRAGRAPVRLTENNKRAEPIRTMHSSAGDDFKDF